MSSNGKLRFPSKDSTVADPDRLVLHLHLPTIIILLMFFETLYRTDPRGKTFQPGDPVSISETEYFQPFFDSHFADGKQVFFVRETHGYFDDKQKKVVLVVTTLAPEEGLATAEEAWIEYEAQLRFRALQGFVHAFSVNIPKSGMNYRILDPKAASLQPDLQWNP